MRKSVFDKKYNYEPANGDGNCLECRRTMFLNGRICCPLRGEGHASMVCDLVVV